MTDQRPTWADDERMRRGALEILTPNPTPDTATIRLAGTELQGAHRHARLAADTHPMDLGWLAVIAQHHGRLSEALVTGDQDAAVLAIRKMQADLEACKQDITR